MKKCNTCKKEKELTDFNKSKDGKHGRRAVCKECLNKKRRSLNNPVSVKNKQCPQCGETKEASEFSRSKRSKSGLASWCKACVSKQIESQSNTVYVEEKHCSRCGKTKVSSEFYKDKKSKNGLRAWCKTCEKQLNSLPETKARINKRNLERWRTDSQFRLSRNLQSLLNSALKGIAKESTVQELVGCSTRQLRAHFERQFVEGMTWNNRGKSDDCWQVDHIVPRSQFDLTEISQQKLCFHYSNLQPLWTRDNRAKGYTNC